MTRSDTSAPGRIDVHAHYYPAAFLDMIEAEGCDCGACLRRTPQGPVIDAGPLHAGPLAARFTELDLRIAEMDAQGVDMQALSLTQPMVYWAEAALARRLSACFNDELVRAHERHPTRLVGLATLPVHHTGEALAELDRIAGAPGVRGVYLGTHIGDMDLADPSLWPVYEVVEARGLPVFLHPLKVIGMEDRLKPYFLANLLGNPFDTTLAAAKLIFGGVLDRFPRLDFVLPHAGGALPFLIGRLRHGGRVRPELRHLRASPESYLRRFHYDTIAHDDAALDYLVRLVGADRVLLGSDYCFDMGVERPVEAVTGAATLSDEEVGNILGANAWRLLDPKAG
jgi:aminocarboxymuconate-semialdehyde decarboxylase